MMNIIAELQVQRAPLGRKPDPVATGRLAEAKRLTALMSSADRFSFVRLGDKDLAFLLDPHGVVNALAPADGKISGTDAFGTPGLEADQLGRLRAALERASYLDYHECLWKDHTWIDKADLHRPAGAERNPSYATSYILPTWLEYECQAFCRGRRLLFCGAEAPLLESLHRRKVLAQVARGLWAPDSTCFFLRPPNNGKSPGKSIDALKAALGDAISRWKIEVLFLSLGGAAKILCQELADAYGVRAIDFGVGLRALTYSGSGGYMASRATHLVFLYRVPFSVYMDALEEAFPDLAPEQLLAKAHAQLLLEVQKKEVGWSHSAWEFDFSPENIELFQAAFSDYRRRYSKVFRSSHATREQRAHFLHFCGSHNLTREGQLFLAWFRAKSAVANVIRRKP